MLWPPYRAFRDAVTKTYNILHGCRKSERRGVYKTLNQRSETRYVCQFVRSVVVVVCRPLSTISPPLIKQANKRRR